MRGATTARGYEVRPVDSRVCGGPEREFLLHRGVEVSEEKFKRFYSGNPQGSALVWIANDSESGELAGKVALLSRTLVSEAKMWRAGIAADFAVIPSHRGFGPALSLQRHAIASCESGEFDVIYGMPNAASLPLLLRAGYRDLGKMHCITKPLQTYERLRDVVPAAVAHPLALAANTVLRSFSRETYSFSKSARKFEWPELANRAVAAPEQEMLCGVRNWEYLHWRYSGAARYELFAETSDDGAVLSYAVIRKNKECWHIVDLWPVPSRSSFGTFRRLMTGLISAARRERCESISMVYYGADRVEEALRPYGFLRRAYDYHFVGYASREDLGRRFADKEHCYVTEGDTDL